MSFDVRLPMVLYDMALASRNEAKLYEDAADYIQSSEGIIHNLQEEVRKLKTELASLTELRSTLD